MDIAALPFGTFRLGPAVEALRRVPIELKAGRMSRLIAAGIRRLSLLGRRDPLDVEVFPGVKGRIYPRSNRCEKAIFTGVQFWDREELEAIGQSVARSSDRSFVFVDVGANVGLYSLYTSQAARVRNKSATIVAIEPDPVNRGRLVTNLAFNEFHHVKVSPLAAGSSPGRGVLVGGERNRGERTVSAAADGAVEIDTLYNILTRFELPRIDAMKIDTEGSDCDVMDKFFSEAPAQLWPTLLIIEMLRGSNSGVASLCSRYGYRVEKTTRLNAILVRDGAGGSAAGSRS